MSADILRISIAKIFTGWTLEYIDSLPIEEINRMLSILEGMNMHEKQLAKSRK